MPTSCSREENISLLAPCNLEVRIVREVRRCASRASPLDERQGGRGASYQLRNVKADAPSSSSDKREEPLRTRRLLDVIEHSAQFVGR